MAFDSVGRYAATHKPWDHFGNIIPDIEHSEGIRPAFPFKPAAWLPVQFWDKHFEQWYTVMPGKVLALDPLGRVMPAEYGATSASVTYTANDVIAKTIDITTGLPVTSAKTVTLSTVDGSTFGFMGRPGLSFGDSVRKYPIGVAPYAYHQWAGNGGAYDDGWNPAGFTYHNYNMQHQVAVLCDYVIKLPLIPGQVAAENIHGGWTDAAITFGTKGWHNLTNIQATARYNATTGYLPALSTYNICALALDNYPVAKNTVRTTMSSTLSTLLVTEVDSLAAVSAPGYYFIDYPVGVIFVYSAGGSTLPAVTPTTTLTYYHYATAPSVYSVFSCVLSTTTELMPGDLLSVGAGSNLVRFNPAAAASVQGDWGNVVGQVLGFETHPQDALDRVKTAFNPAIGTSSAGSMANATLGSASVNLGQMDQMPGSATGGMPDTIHYSGAADTLVIVNLIGR